MNYIEVKACFNSEWINKLCDDLQNSRPFVQRNKKAVLETLLVAIQNSIDLSIPIFKKQRQAYLFVASELEKELEKACYIA